MSFSGDKSVYKLLNDSLIWSKEVGVSNISFQILKWQEGQLGKLDDLLLQGRNTQNHSNKQKIWNWTKISCYLRQIEPCSRLAHFELY